MFCAVDGLCWEGVCLGHWESLSSSLKKQWKCQRIAYEYVESVGRIFGVFFLSEQSRLSRFWLGAGKWWMSRTKEGWKADDHVKKWPPVSSSLWGMELIILTLQSDQYSVFEESNQILGYRMGYTTRFSDGVAHFPELLVMSVVRHESFLIFEVSCFSGGGSLFSLCWCCWSISFTFSVCGAAGPGRKSCGSAGWMTHTAGSFLFAFFSLPCFFCRICWVCTASVQMWQLLSFHFSSALAGKNLNLSQSAVTLRLSGAQKFAGSETMWSKVHSPASVLRGIQWFLLHRCRLLKFLLCLH